jgi:hypothetical protein
MSMTLIAHQELTSAQSSITFSSIPQTFTDLVLVSSLRGNEFCRISLNGSDANTTMKTLWGLTGAVWTGNYSQLWQPVGRGSSTANTFSNNQVYITNYRLSTGKAVSIDAVDENNSGASYGSYQLVASGLWNNTAAVSSITLTSLDANLNPSGNFATGSTATLYGVLAGSSGGVTVS